jgi:nucleotide-binding universal stress UspA family protein
MESREEQAFATFARDFVRRHRDVPPSRTIKRILVPTDFSSGSLDALDYAEELARVLDATLLLLHVERVPVAGSKAGERAHAAAAEHLGKVVEELAHHGLRVEMRLREGAPDEEIADVAASEHVDLIVMGTRGRTGVAHALLGSIAERVVRTSPCPVLTVGTRARA